MGVPLLGVPGIFLDSVLVVEHNTPLKQSVEKVPSMGFCSVCHGPEPLSHSIGRVEHRIGGSFRICLSGFLRVQVSCCIRGPPRG